MNFQQRKKLVENQYKKLLNKKNKIDEDWTNGVFERYVDPIMTNEHVPLTWRYDYNPETNPYFMERLGVNATLNPGAIEHEGKTYLMARTEGYDRKSIFVLAETQTGVDSLKFDTYPVQIPEHDDSVTNTYDMRLTQHEDGNIYGVWCIEKLADDAGSDLSKAEAQCGLARTKDLKNWERLPDIKTAAAQQRNVVLHPEKVNGKYAFYTRPQAGFIEGAGGGIGFAVCDDIENPTLEDVGIIDPKVYHTIKEVKNGPGAVPIKTAKGWVHIAHGVRACAAGLRYVLYAFVTDLDDPTKVIARPGGHFLAPYKEERIGDVSNVVFLNGVVTKENGDVFIYYASSDTRIHVATSTIDRLLDYCFNTPEDGLRSYVSTQQRIDLIKKNQAFLEK